MITPEMQKILDDYRLLLCSDLGRLYCATNEMKTVNALVKHMEISIPQFEDLKLRLKIRIEIEFLELKKTVQ